MYKPNKSKNRLKINHLFLLKIVFFTFICIIFLNETNIIYYIHHKTKLNYTFNKNKKCYQGYYPINQSKCNKIPNDLNYFYNKYFITTDDLLSNKIAKGTKIIPFFWHIPKAAGTTYESIMIWQYNISPIIRIGNMQQLEYHYNQLKANHTNIPKYISSNYIYQLQAYFQLIQDISYPQIIKFHISCLLRHPIERSYSLYLYLNNDLALHESTNFFFKKKKKNYIQYIQSNDMEKNWLINMLSNSTNDLPLASYILKKYINYNLIEYIMIAIDQPYHILKNYKQDFDINSCKLLKSNGKNQNLKHKKNKNYVNSLKNFNIKTNNYPEIIDLYNILLYQQEKKFIYVLNNNNEIQLIKNNKAAENNNKSLFLENQGIDNQEILTLLNQYLHQDIYLYKDIKQHILQQQLDQINQQIQQIKHNQIQRKQKYIELYDKLIRNNPFYD